MIGTVPDSTGVAVGGALVEITASGAAANLGRSTTTDSAGRYRFDGLTFSGDSTLRASATGQKTDARVLFMILGSPTASVDFIGKLVHSLRGTIRDRSSGQPIVGAHIFSANLGTHPNAGREAYTDSAGHYVITDLALASFSVNIQAAGYVSTTQPVSMTTGTETYTLDSTLWKP